MQGNSLVFTKNPVYWDSETIAGQKYKLPFVDKITYRFIKDEQTFITALRTAKLDLLEAVRWSHVDELKKSAPKIQWNRYLANGGQFVALRMDTKPFDDIRVRRALNLAVDKQAIIKSYYGGNAEMLAYPMHPTYTGYYEPLSQMPDSVKELYTYNPAKAKQLLAEAGLPERLHLQGADQHRQRRRRPAADGGRLPGQGGRQDGNPGAGLRRLLLGHDDAHQRAGLFHVSAGQHQPDDGAAQELRQGPGLEPVAVQRSRDRQEDGRGATRRATSVCGR